MGGFVLVQGDDEVEVLSPNRFDDLFATRRIGLPWITEKDIQDRSKGDVLSKGLVIIQTSWFIAQCVSRRIQGLAITEIELITLAFAFLNSLMYFLWWEKPQNVTSYIRIHLVDSIPPPKLMQLSNRSSAEEIGRLTSELSRWFTFPPFIDFTFFESNPLTVGKKVRRIISLHWHLIPYWLLLTQKFSSTLIQEIYQRLNLLRVVNCLKVYDREPPYYYFDLVDIQTKDFNRLPAPIKDQPTIMVPNLHWYLTARMLFIRPPT